VTFRDAAFSRTWNQTVRTYGYPFNPGLL